MRIKFDKIGGMRSKGRRFWVNIVVHWFVNGVSIKC